MKNWCFQIVVLEKTLESPLGFFRFGLEISCGETWSMLEDSYFEPKGADFLLGGLVLESPLNCKDIQPVHPKGNHSWILTGRTDAEAETPVLWPSDVKNWLIGKDWMLGKMEGRRRRGRQRMRWLDGITDSVNMTWVNSGSWRWTGSPGMLQAMTQALNHTVCTILAPSPPLLSLLSPLVYVFLPWLEIPVRRWRET